VRRGAGGEVGGDFSIKLEDQVLITETGYENLTRYPFDARLMGNHRSVNGEDWPRYVAFVDVLRPSRLPALQAVLVAIVAAFQQVNSVFYTNWTQMRLRDA
jgi:hypothetical protein